MTTLTKTLYHRSKKWLDGAKDHNICQHCGRHGPVVACHYTGLMQHQLGKGRGIKVDDCFVADLCQYCHSMFDNPEFRKSVGMSHDFMFAILKTVKLRLMK